MFSDSFSVSICLFYTLPGIQRSCSLSITRLSVFQNFNVFKNSCLNRSCCGDVEKIYKKNSYRHGNKISNTFLSIGEENSNNLWAKDENLFKKMLFTIPHPHPRISPFFFLSLSFSFSACELSFVITPEVKEVNENGAAVSPNLFAWFSRDCSRGISTTQFIACAVLNHMTYDKGQPPILCKSQVLSTNLAGNRVLFKSERDVQLFLTGPRWRIACYITSVHFYRLLFHFCCS